MEKERNSEMYMIGAGATVIAANILGVDVKEIIALLTGASEYYNVVNSQLADKGFGDNAVLASLVGLYGLIRAYRKRNR